MGNTITVTMTRASTAFTHTLTYAFGSLSNQSSGVSLSSDTSSATFTPPLSLASQIPNAISGTLTLTCKTWNGSNLIGTKTVSMVIKVPSTVVPIINSVTRSEAITAPAIASTFGGYVRSKSKIKVVTSATGAQGSTIATYTVTLRDANATGTPLLATYYGNDVTTDFLSWDTTTIKIGVSVTDSRGRSASVTYNETVLAYEPPKITAFSAFRSDSAGNPDYEGTSLKISLNFEIATINNLNGKYYEIVYKTKGASSWAGTVVSGNIYSKNDSLISTSVFSGDSAYELALNISDTFGNATASFDIPTAFTLFDCRSTGKGIAFGKVSEKDAMEIALDVDLTGKFIQGARTAATLQNSWVNYGGYEMASYWKDKCNVVHLAGLIKGGITTAETVIFKLPAGYRPGSNEKFFAVSMNAICVIDVYSSGNVAIKTGANTGWLSLSGISFRAAD